MMTGGNKNNNNNNSNNNNIKLSWCRATGQQNR
jgi:hypothetical protein